MLDFILFNADHSLVIGMFHSRFYGSVLILLYMSNSFLS